VDETLHVWNLQRPVWGPEGGTVLRKMFVLTTPPQVGWKVDNETPDRDVEILWVRVMRDTSGAACFVVGLRWPENPVDPDAYREMIRVHEEEWGWSRLTEGQRELDDMVREQIRRGR
jgi:hypothetical protein